MELKDDILSYNYASNLIPFRLKSEILKKVTLISNDWNIKWVEYLWIMKFHFIYLRVSPNKFGFL